MFESTLKYKKYKFAKILAECGEGTKISDETINKYFIG